MYLTLSKSISTCMFNPNGSMATLLVMEYWFFDHLLFKPVSVRFTLNLKLNGEPKTDTLVSASGLPEAKCPYAQTFSCLRRQDDDRGQCHRTEGVKVRVKLSVLVT